MKPYPNLAIEIRKTMTSNKLGSEQYVKKILIQKYKNVRKWRVLRNSAQLKIKNNNGLFLSTFNLKHHQL